MIRSMTGFGRAQAVLDGIDLSVEINSVNRRNLETSVSLPREWQALERDIQNLLREQVHRGKVQIQVEARPTAAEAGFHWDEAGLESSLRRLGEAAARHGIAWPPDPDALIRVAALNKVETILPPAEAVSGPLLELAAAALGRMLAMREAEGAALGADLASRIDLIDTAMGAIRSACAATVPRLREALLQRLRQAGLELDLADERVLREIALYADRCDISEELTRLESHIVQVRACLGAGSPVGRKLEFILQEVGREFNTIGSKANNIEVNRHVIEAKNELERVREQIQNIE